jgi:hypothetical protein
MVHPSRPPLTPSRPYRWPLNYLEYVKDYIPDVHVKVFKATIRANSEIDDAKQINLFNFTLKDIVFDRCNNYMGDYPNYIFAKFQLIVYKSLQKSSKWWTNLHAIENMK